MKKRKSTSKQVKKAKVKTKNKSETAEYVGNLVELHKIQGAVLRLLQKTLND